MPDDPPWANLGFQESQAAFESPSQRARVWTEGWIGRAMFCPHCGAETITQLPANRKAADFRCASCSELYELKAQKNRFGSKVLDGAYSTKIERLAADDNPHLVLMKYDADDRSVTDLMVVPKHFFTREIIIPRKPLSASARRAGWQGSYINLDGIPAAGKIPVIHERKLLPRQGVLDQWRSTLFLRATAATGRGWLLEVMRCVETLGRVEFRLEDIYAFEQRLSAIYPENRNVRPKIRQQLQVLRDAGWISFEGRGRYRIIGSRL